MWVSSITVQMYDQLIANYYSYFGEVCSQLGVSQKFQHSFLVACWISTKKVLNRDSISRLDHKN